jgi:hypothetical protein
MRPSDFSEEDSPYMRQVLFNPRDNSNSFTNWRINQLLWRRHQFRDALTELAKMGKGGDGEGYMDCKGSVEDDSRYNYGGGNARERMLLRVLFS